MPVYTEFLNLFIRYEALIAQFPRGAVGFKEHCRQSIGIWHDGHLIRMGAMSPMELEQIKSDLRELGLQEHQDFGTDEAWLDDSPANCPPGYVALKGSASSVPCIDASNFHQNLESSRI